MGATSNIARKTSHPCSIRTAALIACERFFCKYLCGYGWVYLPVPPLFPGIRREGLNMEVLCQDEAAELRELEQAVAQLQSLKRHVQVASCAAACACSRACWPLARVAASGNADADAERERRRTSARS
jgi:hypothetical protein